jgi:capsid protein
VLSGALDLPGFAESPAPYLAVKWIPPKWDWVDPLKDRKAEIEAVDAGLKSRSDVIESEGYDAEEVDRRIAADHAREEDLGLSFSRATSRQAEAPTKLDPEERGRPKQSEENAA